MFLSLREAVAAYWASSHAAREFHRVANLWDGSVLSFVLLNPIDHRRVPRGGDDPGTYDGEGDGSDLVSRALALVGAQRQIHVTKRIPPGAGLGGGSSDAAAILRAAGFDDAAAAARIGADVAFCLAGGRARVTGIGELVEPLPYVPTTVTLLTPPLHCSTPAVYRAWDDMGGPAGDNGNDLEDAAVMVEPKLAVWRDRLSDHSGRRARLAGSGSTWFVEGAFPGDHMLVATATR